MKKLLKITLALVIIHCSLLIDINAQVGINTDNSEPDASAMLDVKSDSKGMLVPRMSSSQRTMISNAATGLLVFDTDTESFWFKSNTLWIELVDDIAPMERDAANNVVKPNESTVSVATDDFVFGSSQLDDDGDVDKDSRFFFDKSNGAFRAGIAEEDQWDDSNRAPLSFASGLNTKASGIASVAMGDSSLATGDASFVAGFQNEASGISTVAMGESNTASGNGSIAIGFGNIASGQTAVALGEENEATAESAVALGEDNEAEGKAAIAIGDSNDAREETAIAIGFDNDAQDTSAVAIGSFNTAVGVGSTVLGEFSEATAPAAMALGSGVFADGIASTAVGQGAISTGDLSVALGYEVEAQGASSHAYGNNTIAYSGFETVLGNFNTEYTPTDPNGFHPTDRLFVVGNGTFGGVFGMDNRSDALVMLKNGSTRINGSLTLGTANSDPIDFSYTLPNLKGNTGQILQLNGSLMEWADLSSTTLITDADDDTKIQVEESADDDAIRFDVNGTEYFRIEERRIEVFNTGRSVFIGEKSGRNDDGSNNENVMIGFEAGEEVTTGEDNTGIGAYALSSNQTGRNNTGIGSSALAQNETGTDNVGIGQFTLFDNEKGNDNVAVGSGALDFCADSTTRNVAIGREAGFNMKGDGNVFIGNRAGKGRNGDDRLFIDNTNTATPLIYGEFDNDLVRINGDLEVTGSFPGSDDQTLSFNASNDNLSITDGNSINISGVDDQTLSFNTSNSTLSIADGNSVDLSSLSGGVPVGTIQMWVTETPPTGWLICDGNTFNTTTYPELNTLLNSNRVPDLRRRFPLGAQNIVPNGETNRPLKSTGGAEEVTLNINQIPAHSHSVTVDYNQRSFSGSNNDASDLQGSGDGETFTSSSAGGGEAHNNMPPYYALHFIIKAE